MIYAALKNENYMIKLLRICLLSLLLHTGGVCGEDYYEALAANCFYISIMRYKEIESRDSKDDIAGSVAMYALTYYVLVEKKVIKKSPKVEKSILYFYRTIDNNDRKHFLDPWLRHDNNSGVYITAPGIDDVTNDEYEIFLDKFLSFLKDNSVK